MADTDNRCRTNIIESVVLDRTNLEDLLPHGGEMCLLDSVVDWDNTFIECTAISHTGLNNPLRSGDQLPVMAGVEYAAQAMAVHGTLKANRARRPRMGMLAVLSKVSWSVERLDQLAMPLKIVATQINELEQGACYHFCISSEEQRLIEGEAVIALQNE